MQNVRSIQLRPDFFIVKKDRITFEPFPGRYPTRWSIILKNKKGETKFSYFGKPNPVIIPRVQRLVEIIKGTIIVAEYDKLGAFRFASRNTPRDEITISNHSPVVVSRYYPWGRGNGDFFTNWYHPVHPKLFRLGKKAIFVYSPYESLLADERMVELCRGFRKWLQVSLGNIARSKL